MARVQYGAIVTEIKGKIQGHVFQGGNVGFVLRNKGYTRGISSALRFNSSRILSSIASGWKDLSDSDRATWVALSSSWLFTNKFGASYQGSGFQVYMAYNVALYTLGLSTVTTPNAPASAGDPGVFTFPASTTASLIASVDNIPGVATYMQLYASPPLSVGVNGNNVKYISMGSREIIITTDFDFRAAYLAKYGTYSAGSKIFLKSVFRLADYPYPSFIQYANAIIT